MKNMEKVLLTVAAFGVGALAIHTPSVLAEAMVTSADICDARATALGPGNQIRKKGGEIQNISGNQTIPVSCPLETEFANGRYDIGIVGWNYGGATKKFKCTLTEYDAFSYKVRSYTKAVNIRPDSAELIGYEAKRLSDDTNRFHMECDLPPRGAYGTLFVDSYY